ncbi:hypothetical protein [Winogradskyella sp. SYSU M77433]|uniref:hypothetical protein n=1 Tax=Winogradskyella sp. SYSU M77433 TaxID=3042722 RepID=UPI00248131AF|nr:hypothetical protein [Winogradskyella sp. SYSU M77433]MDH7914235.1 hypothetical protein [Winogradskyella sp. SYSU M77433]
MKKIFCLFAMSISLLACSVSDNSDGDSNPSGTFVSAKVNGSNFLADLGLSGISAQLYENNSVFAFGLAAVDYEGGNNASTIGITFGGIDFGSVIDGFEVFGDGQDFYVSGQYAASINGNSSGGASDENTYLKISSIDKVNQVISGEFSFVAIDNDNPDVTYSVSEGTFNNVSYTIEN